jgi:hypothetical protein
MRTVLIVIATGSTYIKYAKSFIASAKKFFVPHDVAVFSNSALEFNEKIRIYKPHVGYPQATLTRYHSIWAAREELSKYDYMFYSDADMLFVDHVGEEIFSDGITAVEHPGYVGGPGTPETNPDSTAYCPHVRTYFCGGFNGGTSGAFLRMADSIRQSVDADNARGILAIWHDESHLNRYLYDHPPAKILSPSYCYPDISVIERFKDIWYQARGKNHGFVPKLVSLEKSTRL